MNAEKLHHSLQKLIRKNKKKAQKKKQVQKAVETPTYYMPQAQMFYQQRSSFVPQTLAEQYQMETLYRQQLHAEDDDGAASSLYTGAIANQAYATGNISQIQSVQHLVAENEKRQHIEMQYLTEIEARCRALLKEQLKQYNASPVDLNTMKLLEKSTRTLWVSKISELITEKRAEEYCKLYGDVLGVNIVEDEGKRCGFIEFAEADGVQKFLQTSNLMMCGERIVCKPANVTKAAVAPGIAAGYVTDGSTTLSPLFQQMLETVNSRHESQKKEETKPKTMSDYFPNLPE